MAPPPAPASASALPSASSADLPASTTADSLPLRYPKGTIPPSDPVAFTLVFIRDIRDLDAKGELLWDFYVTDYANWTEQTFNQLDRKLKKGLRDLLVERGVYLFKGRHISMTTALLDVVCDERDWPYCSAARGWST